MAARNTINRLTSRIEDLAERRLPRRGPLTIVGADEAECRARLKEIEATGQRPARVRFIMTGVPRSNRYGAANKSRPEISNERASQGSCSRPLHPGVHRRQADADQQSARQDDEPEEVVGARRDCIGCLRESIRVDRTCPPCYRLVNVG